MSKPTKFARIEQSSGDAPNNSIVVNLDTATRGYNPERPNVYYPETRYSDVGKSRSVTGISKTYRRTVPREHNYLCEYRGGPQHMMTKSSRARGRRYGLRENGHQSDAARGMQTAHQRPLSERSAVPVTITIENSNRKTAAATSLKSSSYASVLKPGLIEVTPAIKNMIFEPYEPSLPAAFSQQSPKLDEGHQQLINPCKLIERETGLFEPVAVVSSLRPTAAPFVSAATHSHVADQVVPLEVLVTALHRDLFPLSDDNSPVKTVAIASSEAPLQAEELAVPQSGAVVVCTENTAVVKNASSLVAGKAHPDEADVTVDDAVLNNGSEENIDPSNFHVLETSWTFYHMNNTTRRKGADWNSGIQTIGIFDTAEEFFHCLNAAPRPSETGRNQDYMFFRGGNGPRKTTAAICAAWEDSKNSEGGMWRFSLPVRSGSKSGTLDFFWKEILMAMIGEQFGDHNESVNGCCFCNRGDEYRLQVWMATNEPKAVTSVGARLAEILQLSEHIYFDYCSHLEIDRKGNRSAAPLHDQKEILRILGARKRAR